ncbi:MAG: S1 RNA-binding domain-containing protein, partial [Gammaproteobacteria bacterium]|nr:S1 RNA-binding domain-containing protein [Gammaproteobacteria bacterium]
MMQRTPWEAFDDEHHRNERITSTISRIVDFGIFVDLDKGINGIVHLNDLDWVIPGEKAIACYTVGDPIEVVILSIEPERERISLGIKQLTSDPRQDRRGEPPAP